jgi:hypothetical protein
MSRTEANRKTTYRFAINASLTTTCGIEIQNPSDSGVLIALRKFQMHAGSAMNLTVTRRDAPATGGTAVSVTPSPSIYGEAAAKAVTRYFTAAPTLAGSLLDTPLTMQVPASVLIGDTLDAEDLIPLALKPGQVFCFDTGAIVLRGTLVFTEEPWG